MCENFEKIWKNRLSPKKEDQIALYYCICILASRSKKLKKLIPYHDRKALIHGFYTDKILSAIEKGLIIIDKDMDNIKPTYIIQMMNFYVIDYIKHTAGGIDNRSEDKKRKYPIFVNIDHVDSDVDHVDSDVLVDHSYRSHDYISSETIKRAQKFINKLKHHNRLILINACYEQTSLRQLGNIYTIPSIHFRAAKLGIIHGRSYPIGTKNIEDYHKTTLIGRWIKEIYGSSVMPLTKETLIEIFKTLCKAASNR